MMASKRIHEYVQRLPEPLQAEVLDFVEFLLTKVGHNSVQQEERAWTNFSLAMAMRGMEDEDTRRRSRSASGSLPATSAMAALWQAQGTAFATGVSRPSSLKPPSWAT